MCASRRWEENGQRLENTHRQLKDDKELQTQQQVLQNKEIPLRKVIYYILYYIWFVLC